MDNNEIFCENAEPMNVKKRIGYAYVPFQRLGKLYDLETAMRAGTIFPELNIMIDEYERGLYNGI